MNLLQSLQQSFLQNSNPCSISRNAAARLETDLFLEYLAISNGFLKDQCRVFLEKVKELT